MRRALLSLALATLLLPAAARATAPEPVSGTFAAPPPVPATTREAGGNCVTTIPDDFQLSGGLAGSLALDFRIVFHGPCSAFPGFPANFHASASFTGAAEVAGSVRTGSFVGVFAGTIDAQGHAAGVLTVDRGSGGLAGLHGDVTLAGIPGIGGTYAGALHVDPR